ncbi:NADH dehydrogenase [ubiquinone] 1 alpha subcomplex subunit 4-like 2 isoform X2 [Sceloporus undulatus]|uniref:NADH dehydrogenase [ubiquinone] 1 alpha subcomplex subunit 4-like 2 isoform X2 n=1 Tax=Sceloporus undulatus TaxID=8520 RepID=UPI001C4CE6E1|nr:NADH dehydrogenase [ubiquinone] 1 alpha subcomplex subunit 4-like 2 isoform X2 [Sceloporus undulatus]
MVSTERSSHPACCHSSVVTFFQLIPLIGFIGLGLGSAALYLLRLAIYSPDVSWDRKNNPEPWNKLSPNDQYKFMAVSTDYKTLKKDRPDF